MKLTPNDLVSGIQKRLGGAVDEIGIIGRKAGATGRNVAEYLLTGGLVIEPEESPYEVVASAPMYRLRRYFPDDIREGLPPIVLIPPLLIVCDVYDVAPRSSVVRSVHEHGMDAWVVDFGRPEEEPGGLERTVADHVIAVSDVVDHVREVTGRPPILAGYSQGGLFAYQVTAYRRGEGVDSIVALGAPVDFTAAPLPTPVVPVSAASYMHIAQGLVALGVLPKVTMPPWVGRQATRLTDPVSSWKFQLKYMAKLHDRDALLPGEQQRQFLDRKGFTAYPGTAMLGLFETIADNRTLVGGIVVGDRSISLADIECPILTIVGERDREGAAVSARAIDRAAPKAPIYELTLGTGHFGMVASSAASRNTWPRVAGWARWRAGLDELPEAIVPAAEVTSTKVWAPTARGQQLQQVADLAIDLSRVGLKALTHAGEVAQAVIRDGGSQLPLVSRLELVQAPPALTLGGAVHHAGRTAPDRVAYVVDGVVVRNDAFDREVDDLAARLIVAGLRVGDRVGVLDVRGLRALVLLAAVNRVGAVAVLARSIDDLAHSALRGARAVVIAADQDPGELSGEASRWSVDGEAADGVTALNELDVRRFVPPDWYVANPARLDDVAFVTFEGHGPTLSASSITQRQWAASGHETAAALGLKRASAVGLAGRLCQAAEIHALAGALAAGSRLAFLDDQSPTSFWRDVRRAGVTHMVYSGSSLDTVTRAPCDLLERGQPLRVFFGDGMPPAIRRRLLERFPDTRVVDLYRPRFGQALVARTSGISSGTTMTHPRDTSRLRVVHYDVEREALELDRHGLARETKPGCLGALIVRADGEHEGPILRGLFAPDDAWLQTGDAFVRAGDGDLVHCDRLDDVVVVDGTPVSPGRIVEALAALPQIELAVAYPEGDQVIADVHVDRGTRLDAWDLVYALRVLDRRQWPERIRVLPTIGVDAAFRAQVDPTARSLQEWRISGRRDAYEPDPTNNSATEEVES